MNENSTIDGDDEALGMPSNAARMALIAGIVLLALAFAAALLIDTRSPATVANCASIEDAALRLRCYDSTAHRPTEPPARGATVPKLD